MKQNYIKIIIRIQQIIDTNLNNNENKNQETNYNNSENINQDTNLNNNDNNNNDNINQNIKIEDEEKLD